MNKALAEKLGKGVLAIAGLASIVSNSGCVATTSLEDIAKVPVRIIAPDLAAPEESVQIIEGKPYQVTKYFDGRDPEVTPLNTSNQGNVQLQNNRPQRSDSITEKVISENTIRYYGTLNGFAIDYTEGVNIESNGKKFSGATADFSIGGRNYHVEDFNPVQIAWRDENAERIDMRPERITLTTNGSKHLFEYPIEGFTWKTPTSNQEEQLKRESYQVVRIKLTQSLKEIRQLMKDGEESRLANLIGN